MSSFTDMKEHWGRTGLVFGHFGNHTDSGQGRNLMFSSKRCVYLVMILGETQRHPAK